MITFLALYPDKSQEKDGMMQRILNIDKDFEAYPRQYIDISIRRNSSKKCIEYSPTLKEYKINLIWHFWLIFKLLKSSNIIYIHSIFNSRYPLLFLLILRKKKKIYLDVHGTVPEEMKLIGNRFWKLYNMLEKTVFKLITSAIYVTEAMRLHFEKKYPTSINCRNIVYNIYPNFSPLSDEITTISDSETVVIYSGNCQKWQNIDLMLNIIKENRSEHIKYIILTGEPNIFNEKLKEIGIFDSKNISVESVMPSELNKYYSIAHYGFILRDDIIVNRVANPTKMIEYLCYGIIPIVKSPHIGDFEKYNYEYLSYKNFNKEVKAKKSKHNIEVAQKILNIKEDLASFILMRE